MEAEDLEKLKEAAENMLIYGGKVMNYIEHIHSHAEVHGKEEHTDELPYFVRRGAREIIIECDD